VKSEQKNIDECAISAKVSIKKKSKWSNPLSTIDRWIAEEIITCKTVLRLRSYLRLHVGWFSTSALWNYLARNRGFCLVPGNSQWITHEDYVGSDGKLLDEYQEVFDQKKQIHDAWVNASIDLGFYAERIYLEAFNKAGYSPKKVELPISPGSEEKVEIDVLGAKDNCQIGAQVKNVISEVFHNPGMVRSAPAIYQEITQQFECCSNYGIIPILIAPFINGSFYCFTKKYNGLHCQTYLQLFDPGHESLCNAIKKTLKFGNVRTVTEAPDNVVDWISRIPKMWHNKYGK
jgi:hypothetical protein